MIDNSCRHAVMKVMGSDHRAGKGHHQLRDKGVDTSLDADDSADVILAKRLM